MPAPASTDEFLELVQKSGVVEDARLKAHIARLGELSGVPTDPTKLASVLVRDGLLTFFQADQLLQGKWKRFSIGKYRVLERIGVGGMGQVFLCEHKLMRRRVALKVLPAAKAQDPASLERFHREARAVAALDHPNIVRAYDIDQDDNLHFLVMEYVDGTNLQDLVKKTGPLDPVRAAHYMYGAAIGLHHALGMGLIHRDIKPGNILIDRAGVVKILDMGLARFFHDEDDLLTKKYDENILGTADYLAPEQAIDSHTVDIRADIYSLGGTFYFLLTGQPPFPEGSVAQKLLWHQTREPTPLLKLRPGLPASLATIVEKMMAKDTAARYQSPADVIAALAPWVQTPISPPSDKEMPQLSPAIQGMGSSQAPLRTGPTTPSNGNARTASQSSLNELPVVSGKQPDAIVTPAARAVPQTATPPTAMHPVAATPVQAKPVATAPTAAPAPTVTAKPVAAPAPAANPATIWSELTETEPEMKPVTDRAKKKPVAAEPTKPAKSNRVLLFVALGAAGLFVLFAGGVTAAYFLFFKKSTTNAETQGKWYVTAGKDSPNPERTLTTLRGALEQAKPGETIVLLDDRIEEPPVRVSDRGTNQKKGVAIEAGNAAKLVTWAPRSSGRGQAILTLADVEDLRVSGLQFELGGAADCGITVGGNCPGLVIENVIVRHPRSVGFRFDAVRGEPGRPVVVKKSRVIFAEPKPEAGMVLFACRNLQVADCRFEGPGLSGVRVDGSASDVELRNNRIHNFEVGVRLSGKLTNETPYNLTVENNTFHTITTAGMLADHPFAGAKQTVTLTKNYFGATKEIATSPAAAVPGFKATDNGRDKATTEGKLDTKSQTLDDLPAPNPEIDGEFLLPVAGKSNGYGAQME